MPTWLSRVWVGALLTSTVVGAGLAMAEAPLTAASVGLCGAAGGWGWGQLAVGGPPAPRRAPLLVASGVVAVLGWLAAGGPTLLVPFVGTAVGAVVVHRGRAGRKAGGVTRDPAELTDAQLCLAWRLSFSVLSTGPDQYTLGCLVDRRRSYLDELERRHPEGFAAWLSSPAPAAGDPGPFLSSRGDDPG